MPLTDLTFPVLAFNQGIVEAYPDEDRATTCTATGLRKGWYRSLLLVDSTGKAVKVKSGRKLHGVGWLRGYRLLTGQIIKVELDFVGEPESMPLPEIRKRVLAGLKGYGQSVDPDYWRELKAKIEAAESVPELIRLVPP